MGAILSYRYLDMGWVRQLGVLPTWRHQGIATALLYQVFGTFYEQRIDKVGLGVNAQNSTGATELYKRVGMGVERQYDTYTKILQAGG